MREIKFRAWNYNLNRWTLFDGFADNVFVNFFRNASGIFYLHDHSDTGGEDICLMQYTGRRDASGAEIYEGDILKDDSEPSQYERDYHLRGIGVVEWSEKDAGYILKWFNSRGDSMRPQLTDMLTKYRKIAGNICENPELLKGAL